jgi:RNA polymerase sigma-70 factor (ECF subfamily)
MSLLLARRQERVFERLYRRHVGDVYRYALAVLRDPEDAESVTQATFVNAYRAHKRGERPRKPRNWVLSLAHDACRRRYPAAEDRSDDLPDDERELTPTDMRRALRRLPFDERSALRMREVECRSYAEIAELLELDDREVEALVFRARQAFREQLERSLTCHQAERAVSRQLDGLLTRAERKQLRAHLRWCPECERFAYLQRSHRAAIRSYELEPLPEALRVSDRGSVRAAPLARTAAVAAIALVAGGLIAGGVDPREWGRDATEVVPAEAAQKQRGHRANARTVELARPRRAPG